MDVMTWIRQEHGALGPRMHDWFVSEIPLARWTERPNGTGASAAWLVMHTAVHQDIAMNVVVQDQAPVAALHFPDLGLDGIHWSVPLNEPDQLASHPDVDVTAVLRYVDAVNTSTAGWLASASSEDLDAAPPVGERLTFAGITAPDVQWVHQRWAGKPVSWFVQWEAIGHTLLHQGELAAMRVSLGLRS